MGRVRILVLGNGAAGAEKQALALSTRLRRHLERAGALISSDDTSAAEQLIRVPLKPSAIFQKLPPAPQLIGSRATRDPFFGYTATDEQKRLLLGVGDGDNRVVIGSGRATVALCAALKQSWANAKRSSAIFNVQIQHPRVALDLFDAVIVPRHDFHGNSAALKERPANLHLTYGTVCSVDHDVLQQAGEAWQSVLGGYSNKTTCITWLIGGPCRGLAFSEKDANDMVDQVLQLVTQRRPSVSLLVTFSRRTPLQVQAVIRNRLQSELDGDDELFVWDGSGANPFDAMLHHATAIVTTPDSISMTTEAIATGKPVFTVCADRISGKFHSFHETLFRENFTTALSLRSGALVTEPSSHGREAIENELETIAVTLAQEILRQS